jgi:hypothetical protein
MHAAVDALNTNTPQPRGALVFVSQSAEDWSAYDPLLGEINNGALRARRRQVQ